MTADISLTEQLQLFFAGDRTVVDSLLPEILPTLRQIAARELSRERRIAGGSATELINEIWLRHLCKASWQIHDRGHFFAIASLAMRRVLTDAARRRSTEIRAHPEQYSRSSIDDASQIVEIGMAMEIMERNDSDGARIVDMRYYGGLTFVEIAQSTDLTVRQVRIRWARGLKSLKAQLCSTKKTSKGGFAV
jgi:RNA polymerase sigma factor (TIGR02999 family)